MKKAEAKQSRVRSYPRGHSIGRPKGISVTLEVKKPLKRTSQNKSSSSFYSTLDKSLNQLDNSIGVQSRFQTIDNSVVTGEQNLQNLK